jgi:hypothetical protein
MGGPPIHHLKSWMEVPALAGGAEGGHFAICLSWGFMDVVDAEAGTRSGWRTAMAAAAALYAIAAELNLAS